ncbi:uncharacterized protein LOC130714633 isoform X2 [Lotus japonicus]|uniref:uncharacterized protein LOC130714633 isoform X2 n=1 Tax=Lotus japonicus TaxID=34305 RepID=UPI002583EFCF|nr:uncharacterized protein LOC130714633 isoform X2 [Lotus japonicus]
MAEVWHRTLFLKWWMLAGCSYSIWVFLQIFRFGAPMLWDYGVPVCALVSFFYVVLDCEEGKVSNTSRKMTPLPRTATGSMSKLILHLWWLLCLRYQHGFRVKRSTAVYPTSRPFPPLILAIDGNV